MVVVFGHAIKTAVRGSLDSTYLIEKFMTCFKTKGWFLASICCLISVFRVLGQLAFSDLQLGEIPERFIEDVSRSNSWSQGTTNTNISSYPLILLGAEGHDRYRNSLWGYSSGKMMDYRLAEDWKRVFVKRNCASCKNLPSSILWSNWSEVAPALKVFNETSNPIFESKQGDARLGDFVQPNYIIVSKVDLITRRRIDLHVSIIDIEKNTPIAIESYKNVRLPIVYRDNNFFWSTRFFIGAGTLTTTGIITSIRRSRQKDGLDEPLADVVVIEERMAKQRRIASWSYVMSGVFLLTGVIVASF
jgi:hypothetical protein